MQSVRPTVPRARQTSSLVGGCCLLFLYFVTATPLAPVLYTLLAELDRSHHVAIHQTTQGLQVVLQHGGLNTATHHHGMVARALTVFARHTTARQSDHVIQFGAMDAAQRTSVLAIEPASNSPDPEGNVAGYPVVHAAAVTWELAASPRPPPVQCGLLLTVRSTVLRI